MSSSSERQRQIKLRAEERQINKVHDEQRAQLFDIQPYNSRPTHVSYGKVTLFMMTDGSFEQHAADLKAVGDNVKWLKEQETYIITLFNGVPIAVAPPNHIELEVVETDPGLKGDTAQGGSKPATLSAGAVVSVPLFIEEGEMLRVDTRSGDYVSRATKK